MYVKKDDETWFDTRLKCQSCFPIS